jgi:hypothetical protein
MRASISKLFLSLKLIDEGTNCWQRMQRTWISLPLATLNLPLLVYQHPDASVFARLETALYSKGNHTISQDKKESPPVLSFHSTEGLTLIIEDSLQQDLSTRLVDETCRRAQVVSLKSCRSGRVAAVPLKRDSKCKEVIPFYCSSLANPVRLRRTRGMHSLKHFHALTTLGSSLR